MPPSSVATITPGRCLAGRLQVPGDKSIAHRYALFAALAEGHWSSRTLRRALIAGPRWLASAAIAVGAPLVETMRRLGISDTSFGLAIAQTTISLPLSVWLMSGFFEAVPIELDEAARVDGATGWQALRRWYCRSSAGGLAVTALFAFLASWNEFLFALLLTHPGAGPPRS